MHTAIWWIRRDLRLTDNQAFGAALKCAGRVVPVFILDPRLWTSRNVGEKRLAFLLDGLRSLSADLEERGSRLIVRSGNPTDVLPTLMAEIGAETVCAEADYSAFAHRRDAAVGRVAPLRLAMGLTLFPPDLVLRRDGRPYTIYTPFSQTWKQLPMPDVRDVLLAPRRLPAIPDLASEAIPDYPRLPQGVPFVSGEAEAQRRLQVFIADRIGCYSSDRDRMDLDGTSGLSPYLRFGMLSVRQAVVAALEARRNASQCEAHQGAEIWLNELIWREFYISILHQFPNVRAESFRPALRQIPWRNDPGAFAAWCEGRTGYPVVDAAMRQLTVSGWMHNRARMIVASFLTKDLLIDWRWGEAFFMQHLVDGDPAANNGGWQWSAGTGTDAAPYFRVFNPVLQGERYDPEGHYVRRWAPELAHVPLAHLHHPWTMPEVMQSAVGCIIGRDYPAPVVDHAWARSRILAAYALAKEKRTPDAEL